MVVVDFSIRRTRSRGAGGGHGIRDRWGEQQSRRVGLRILTGTRP